MADANTKKPGGGWLNIAVDYSPLLVFLTVYNLFSPAEDTPGAEIMPILYGTGAFMITAVIALIVSKMVIGKVSPMLWFSTVLIVVFGGFTLWTGEKWIIQAKPTALYLLFGVALLGGWMKGRALLKILLEAAFEGLSDEGWLKLSRNWGVFFLGLAGLNAVLVMTLSFEGWLWAKFWVFMPLTFLFTFANFPMLLKHGLDVGQNQQEQDTKG
ncbi:MAG: septation protein IspZ [Pseudomonadota bacterium]